MKTGQLSFINETFLGSILRGEKILKKKTQKTTQNKFHLKVFPHYDNMID